MTTTTASIVSFNIDCHDDMYYVVIEQMFLRLIDDRKATKSKRNNLYFYVSNKCIELKRILFGEMDTNGLTCLIGI
jgi:hypothetical protein